MATQNSVIPLSGPRSSDALLNAPPPIVLPIYIPLQSYLDASFEAFTPPAAALQAQPVNRGLVDSTAKEYQASGFAVGVAPWSECPVSFFFRKPDSPAIPMRPGQIMVPFPNGFTAGFDYGCPRGWLGGGQSEIFVFRSRDSLPDWGGSQREVLFHRFRTTIRQTSDTQPVNLRHNWPTRFPWPWAFRGETTGSKAINQTGEPILQVKPTRTLVRLNGNIAQAAGLFTRMVFWGTDDFDTSGALPGVVSATGNFFYDFFWPPNQGFPGMSTNNPVVEIPAGLAAQASNAYGVTFDVPAGNALLEATVDVLRYGIIGG